MNELLVDSLLPAIRQQDLFYLWCLVYIFLCFGFCAVQLQAEVTLHNVWPVRTRLPRVMTLALEDRKIQARFKVHGAG